MKMKTRTTTFALIASAVFLSACASKNQDDPLEPFNRGVHSFNTVLDKGVFRPVAKGYRYITPRGIRTRIGNVSDNLKEPVNMLNAFLQGDFEQGMTSFWRFAINTTIGIGGINDVAASAGLKRRSEDFGQTLGVWGVGSGPYLVLPIFGPSNPRDAVGTVVDWFTTPWNYAIDDTSDEIALGVAQGLVTRERLIDPIDDMYDSLDPYAAFRSSYMQYRDAAVRNSRESNAYGDARK